MAICHFLQTFRCQFTRWIQMVMETPWKPPRSPEALAVGVVVAAAAQRPTAWKAAAPGRLELEDLTGESLLMVK